MKRFLITYTYRLEGAHDEWHRHVADFIAAIEADPALNGKINYRCLKAKEGDRYFHLAEAADDAAIAALTASAFFKRYNDQTKHVAGGAVEVIALETIAETQRFARVPAQ